MRLHWLRVSDSFRRANPYSKQQLQIWSQLKVFPFCERASGTEAGPARFGKHLVLGPRERQTRERAAVSIRLGCGKSFSAVHNWYPLCNNRTINNQSCYN